MVTIRQFETLAGELFDYLDAPIKRVAAGDFPIPFSPPLEDFVLPMVSGVIEATRKVTYR
jgi:pyruvate dehydrogenase E1 component beta subunit